LKAIRRKNATGYHYFIANLSPNDVSETITLAVPFKDARWFNPLNGDIYAADIENRKIKIHLRSGESMILQTFSDALAPAQSKFPQATTEKKDITGPWTLTFKEATPTIEKTYRLPQLQTWELLDEQTRILMGTGVYTAHIKFNKKEAASKWMIDLGDVRESARVYINGEYIGCAWSVPFTLNTGNTLKAGDNEIRIEVTNLPANRISELDRKGVKWRKMEEINVVDINYKKTLYDQWEPTPSGLGSKIQLIKLL
jgi:hypothetical protein